MIVQIDSFSAFQNFLSNFFCSMIEQTCRLFIYYFSIVLIQFVPFHYFTHKSNSKAFRIGFKTQ